MITIEDRYMDDRSGPVNQTNPYKGRLLLRDLYDKGVNVFMFHIHFLRSGLYKKYISNEHKYQRLMKNCYQKVFLS